MKFHLLLCICILMLFVEKALAQERQPKLKRFYDEKTCLFSLLNGSDDTLYSDLQRANSFQDESVPKSHQQFYWLIKRGKNIGMINDFGQEVLPLEFDYISNKYGKLVCRKSDTIEVYQFSGKLLYSGNEYKELIPEQRGYLCMKDTLYGILDSAFKISLPIEYEYISPCIVSVHLFSGSGITISTHLFKVNKNNKQGIFDLDRGFVVPVKYQDISERWFDESDNSYAVFKAIKNGYACDWINEYGKVVFNMDSTGVSSLNLDDWYYRRYAIGDTSCIQYALLEDRNPIKPKMSVVNAFSGEMSKAYDHLWINENRILFNTENKWGVLDEHMNEIASWKKMNASWDYVEMKNFDPEIVPQMYNMHHVLIPRKWSNQIDTKDNLVFIWEQIGDSIPAPHLERGLYNYVLKKKIPEKYDDIAIYEMNGEYVYWAFLHNSNRYNGTGKNRTEIFDANFNLLKSGNFIHRNEPNGYSFERNITDLLFYELKEEKTGLVNGKGEVIVPAIYDAYRDLALRINEDEYENFPYYWLKNDSVYGAFDSKGKLVIPFQFENVESVFSVIIGTRTNHKNAVFNIDGVCILDSIDYHFTNQYLHNCLYYKTKMFGSDVIIFFAKGEYVYFYQNGKLNLVDEHTFVFSTKYLQIRKGLMIDRKGRIVHSVNYSQQYAECPLECENLLEDSKGN